MSAGAVSVVIPTIGRPALLLGALESLGECVPKPAEVIVVDQSGDDATGSAVRSVTWTEPKLVGSRGRGRGLAVNEGMRCASGPVVAVFDDDCLVRADWIAVIEDELGKDPEAMISGQVLPHGRPAEAIPSVLTLDRPRDYTGQIRCDVLYAGNMACRREALLSFGGFDERIVPAAEDCDVCYRWLREGRRLRHVPEMVVWHRDWRSAEQLRRHYNGYHRGQGMFYGKHLAGGDPFPLQFLARDLYAAARAAVAAGVRGRPAWPDRRRGVLRNLLPGVWDGIRL